MITLAQNIGINVLSNIIYDVAKNIAIQLQFKKVPETTITQNASNYFTSKSELA